MFTAAFIIERCAGLDVHQETVVACALYGSLEQKRHLASSLS